MSAGRAADLGSASGHNKLGAGARANRIHRQAACNPPPGTLYRSGFVDKGVNYQMALACYKKADEQVRKLGQLMRICH
jgi:hypothetical protein